jgi:hypothetical protein
MLLWHYFQGETIDQSEKVRAVIEHISTNQGSNKKLIIPQKSQ